MLKNHIVSALRSIKGSLAISAINILGLSIGLSSLILIYLYVNKELSIDQFSDADRMFRIETRQISDDTPKWAITPYNLGHKYFESIAQIEEWFLLDGLGSSVVEVKVGDDTYDEDNIVVFHGDAIDMLEIEMLESSSSDPLSEPNSVLLTREIASKYFDEENPIGQIISIGTSGDFMVTGIFEPGRTSHITYEMIVSQQVDAESRGWGYTYVKLNSAENEETVLSQLNAMATELKTPFFQDTNYNLIPVSDVYFQSKSKYQFSVGGNIMIVNVFIGIGVLIALVIIVNYFNLTMSQFMRKFKEVGVRKVLGANSRQVILRLLTEVYLSLLVASLLAILIVNLLIPSINATLGTSFSMALQIENIVISVLVFFALVGLVFIAFPKFISNVKSNERSRRSKKGQSAMLVFQFMISMILIVSSLIASQQIQFLKTQDLGYGEDNIYLIQVNDPLLNGKTTQIKSRFETHAGVISTSTIMGAPGDPGMMGNQNTWAEGMPLEESVLMPLYAGEQEIIKTLGLEIVAGRSFENMVMNNSGSQPIIINEAASQEFGWDDAIGKRMKISGTDHVVVGVVKDFHFLSLQNEIGPLGIQFFGDNYYIGLRVKKGSENDVEAFVKDLWPEISNSRLSSWFLRENFDRQYLNEDRLQILLTVLTILALVISAIGTLGMTLILVELNMKEYGMRKVLGASVPQIFVLINKRVYALLAAAMIFAVPLIYFGLEKWLSAYAFRISQGIEFYLVSGVSLFLIIACALAYHTIRVALKNPIDIVRYE